MGNGWFWFLKGEYGIVEKMISVYVIEWLAVVISFADHTVFGVLK
jgi:hypothetical protein